MRLISALTPAARQLIHCCRGLPPHSHRRRPLAAPLAAQHRTSPVRACVRVGRGKAPASRASLSAPWPPVLARQGGTHAPHSHSPRPGLLRPHTHTHTHMNTPRRVSRARGPLRWHPSAPPAALSHTPALPPCSPSHSHCFRVGVRLNLHAHPAHTHTHTTVPPRARGEPPCSRAPAGCRDRSSLSARGRPPPRRSCPVPPRGRGLPSGRAV